MDTDEELETDEVLDVETDEAPDVETDEVLDVVTEVTAVPFSWYISSFPPAAGE